MRTNDVRVQVSEILGEYLDESEDQGTEVSVSDFALYLTVVSQADDPSLVAGPVTADMVRRAYADVNGADAAGELTRGVLEATARYVNLQGSGTDLLRTDGLIALDVFRLAEAGEFG